MSDLNAKDEIIQILSNTERITEIIENVKWSKKRIYEKKNNEERITLSLVKKRWIYKLNAFIENNKNNIILIPILMFNEKSDHSIEFIWRIKINDNDVGIAFKYDATKREIRVNGIHLEKECIRKQHQLISAQHMNECHCFDGWKSNINSLSIGNVDSLKNKLKDSHRKYDDLFTEKIDLENEIERLKNELANALQSEKSVSITPRQ